MSFLSIKNTAAFAFLSADMVHSLPLGGLSANNFAQLGTSTQDLVDGIINNMLS